MFLWKKKSHFCVRPRFFNSTFACVLRIGAENARGGRNRIGIRQRSSIWTELLWEQQVQATTTGHNYSSSNRPCPARIGAVCVLPSHFGGSASFRVTRFVGKGRLRSQSMENIWLLSAYDLDSKNNILVASSAFYYFLCFDVEAKMICYKLNWNTITVPRAVTHTIALSLWLIWHELIAFGFVTKSR